MGSSDIPRKVGAVGQLGEVPGKPEGSLRSPSRDGWKDLARGESPLARGEVRCAGRVGSKGEAAEA